MIYAERCSKCFNKDRILFALIRVGEKEKAITTSILVRIYRARRKPQNRHIRAYFNWKKRDYPKPSPNVLKTTRKRDSFPSLCVRISVSWRRSSRVCPYLCMTKLRRTPKQHRNVCIVHNSFRGLLRARTLRLNRISDKSSKSWQTLQFPLNSSSVPPFCRAWCFIYVLCTTLPDRRNMLNTCLGSQARW